MAIIENNNIIIPIVYTDEDCLFMDTDKMREDFENLIAELEEDYE